MGRWPQRQIGRNDINEPGEARENTKKRVLRKRPVTFLISKTMRPEYGKKQKKVEKSTKKTPDKEKGLVGTNRLL